MGTKLKIFISFIVIIIILIMTVNIGINIQRENKLDDIYSKRSTVLNNYEKNKSIVEDYLKIYEIVDNDSYQNIKNQLYDFLSVDLKKQLFPTVNYEGLELHPLNVSDIHIIGTNNSLNETNTFIVNYTLTGVNYNQSIKTVIDIKNGIITKAIRLE